MFFNIRVVWYRFIWLTEQSAACITRYSVVNIATSYGLDGPEIEFLQREGFLFVSRLALIPTHSPARWVMCPFPQR